MLDFFDSKLYYIPEMKLNKVAGLLSLLVVVNGSESDAYKAFIQAMLKPFDLGKEDYQIWFFEGELPSFSELKNSCHSDAFLLFGVDSTKMGLQLTPRLYQPFKILKKDILFVESLQLFLEEKKKAEAATAKTSRSKARLLW
ncbi:MAG TPA: hypothetical protein ENK75_06700 [Saprospiraceae bacterium]|nr:hypothetical protein [Saprospiraceae bacterium]